MDLKEMTGSEKAFDIHHMGLEELINFVKSHYTKDEWNNRPKRDIPTHNYNSTYFYRMAVDNAKCKIFLTLKKKSPNTPLVRRLSAYYAKTFWCKQKTGKRKFRELIRDNESPVVGASYGYLMMKKNLHYHVVMDLIQHANCNGVQSVVKDLSEARRGCHEALDELESNILNAYFASNGIISLPTGNRQLEFLEILKKKHGDIRQITAFMQIPPPGIEGLYLTDNYVNAVSHLVVSGETVLEDNATIKSVTHWVVLCCSKLMHLELEILKAYDKVTCFFNEDSEKLKFIEILKNRYVA